MIWAEAARKISHTLRDEYPPEQSLFAAWRILSDVSGEPLNTILPWKSHAEVPEPHARTLDNILSRMRAQEPIEYILGKSSFYSLDITVSKSVLIPRPETEILVESVIGWHTRHDRIPRMVLDLGTGSGCIALALAHAFPDVHVTMVDRSPDALRTAKENISEYRLFQRVSCVASDWWNGLASGKSWDVVVSNPPYIRRADLMSLPISVREFEPVFSLDGGEDGFDGFRAIISGSIHGLSPNGLLALECGWDQADNIVAMINKTDAFSSCWVEKDLSGVPRIILALRKENTHAA